MKRIAVIEDEEYMREELCMILQRAGHEAIPVSSFEDAVQTLTALCPDLVILDLNLPDISGFQLCRDLKQKTTVPVLVLTSRDQIQDELHALELGADEYLTKPCRKDRLLARVANILKRYEGRANLLEGADFLLDRTTYTVYIHNTSEVLPKNQGMLLETLMMAGERIVSARELSEVLWHTVDYVDQNALQVNLTRLKKTMARLQTVQEVETIRGQGYRLVTAADGLPAAEDANTTADGVQRSS